MTSSANLTPWLPGKVPGKTDKGALEALRARFTSDPVRTDLSPLRPVIARSWQRSAMCNVSTSKRIMEAMAEPQLDEQFLRCADPVLYELERLCMDAHGCVSLADPMGTIALFRGEPSMVRWAEKTFPTLGGCMSEDLVGTNSDGTAIEEGSAVQVWGGEHYNEALQDTYCTSVPIRDPLRRSIRGVLSMVLPEQLAIGLDPRVILLIVQAAAAEITRALTERLAAREQALLSEYLREIRKRGAEAVIAMDEHTTIMNRGAMQMLDQSDHAVLAAYARDAGHMDRPAEHEVISASGRVLHLQVRPVPGEGRVAGTVMRLHQSKAQSSRSISFQSASCQQGFPGMIGESMAFRRALESAVLAADRAMPACLFGEAGTGKRHLAKVLASRLAGEGAVTEIDLGTEKRPDLNEVMARIREGQVVLVHRVDMIDPALCDRLVEAVAETSQPLLVLTGRMLIDEMLPLVSALQAVEIEMPPLRTRREDIPLLVAHFLNALDRPRRAAPRLVELLAAAEWPGNVAQLKEAVVAAALQSNGREVRVEDLTEIHRRSLERSRLSRLQKAELQQIREALVETGGNRLRAAAMLRIGRSTLYRRIDFYASRGFDLPTHA